MDGSPPPKTRAFAGVFQRRPAVRILIAPNPLSSPDNPQAAPRSPHAGNRGSTHAEFTGCRVSFWQLRNPSRLGMLIVQTRAEFVEVVG